MDKVRMVQVIMAASKVSIIIIIIIIIVDLSASEGKYYHGSDHHTIIRETFDHQIKTRETFDHQIMIRETFDHHMIIRAELRNVIFFTQSKSLESNFTPRKVRKSRQIQYLNSMILR